MKRIFVKTLVAIAALAATGVTFAQEIKEHTFKFGLNGPDAHPAVAGMKKFAELVAAKSGGKIKINLFLNGALVPIDRFPVWLQAFAKLLPSTQGIIVLRNVLIEGRSLPEVWQDGSLVMLLVHSTVYFVGGWLVLKWCERIAKQQGTLGQY